MTSDHEQRVLPADTAREVEVEVVEKVQAPRRPPEASRGNRGSGALSPSAAPFVACASEENAFGGFVPAHADQDEWYRKGRRKRRLEAPDERASKSKGPTTCREFAQRGDATGWFEQMYAEDQGNEQAIHWADMEVNPHLLEWLDRRGMQGKGKRALVVGCGPGDDAEEVAHRGFEVVAFDIAPSAIAWCRKRFPGHRSSIWWSMCSILPESGMGALISSWKPTPYRFCLPRCVAER